MSSMRQFSEMASAEEGNPRYARDDGHQLARWALSMQQKIFRMRKVSMELGAALRLSDALMKEGVRWPPTCP